jgi:hypothetical protein
MSSSFAPVQGFPLWISPPETIHRLTLALPVRKPAITALDGCGAM